MLCVIYRSSKREQTYLYVEKKDDFSRVPEDLLKSFGRPQLAMVLNLANRSRLAGANIAAVRAALAEQGYYLQLPPPPEDLLKMHRLTQGAPLEAGSYRLGCEGGHATLGGGLPSAPGRDRLNG